jgi:protein-L-isoaspartate(D-aspartate) O-methyltransferase
MHLNAAIVRVLVVTCIDTIRSGYCEASHECPIFRGTTTRHGCGDQNDRRPPCEVLPYAYANTPLPIGFNKTISQPLMVAVMTDLLELKPDDVVLEIGTGLGYQAAVLAELAGRVYSVEIIDELAQRAVQGLTRQGYINVEVRVGNGYFGWPEHAPFDKVIATAAPDLIPPPLINQLKAGGRMVIPVGLPDAQQLVVAEKDLNGRVTTKEIMGVLFSLLEGPDQPAMRAS